VAVLVERSGATAEAASLGRFRALVVIADPATREVVVHGLAVLGAVDVVEAGGVAEALARTRGMAPRELLVTEVALPDGSGIALLGQLRADGWTRGIVLSDRHDPYTVRAALSARVRSFLVTRTPAEAGRAAAVAVRARGRGVEGLSPREVEVLAGVAAGRSNRDIGESLGLSALTVKSHLARIARKLGTGDRAEMVALALRGGVID
jgi:DNA-binding NarL/FixJ family response regulator